MSVMQIGGPALVALSLAALGCQKAAVTPVETPVVASATDTAEATHATSSASEAAAEDAETDIDATPGSVLPRPKAKPRHTSRDSSADEGEAAPALKKSKARAPGTLPPIFGRNQSGLRAELRAQLTATTAETFKSKCSTCHGADGKGQTKKGQKLGVGNMTSTAWQRIFTDNNLRRAILEGFDRTKNGTKQTMHPKVGKLSPEEIRGLVAYVRLFGAK